MSIKGIDTQIMINRSADFSKDASAMQKRPEVQQEFLAAQQKIASAQSQSRVAGTTETEMENIRTDVDGGSGGAYGDGEGKDSDDDEQKGETARNMLVPPGNNMIDIKI